MERKELNPETRELLDEILRIGQKAVQLAQEESRRLGVPNVYSIDGVIYYELPSGELSRTDPYLGPPALTARSAGE
jgi:hypothetical protein